MQLLNKLKAKWPLIALASLITFLLVIIPFGQFLGIEEVRAAEEEWIITGQLLDPQGQGIEGAEVTAYQRPSDEALFAVESLEDGYWILHLAAPPSSSLYVSLEHPHYQNQEITLSGESLANLVSSNSFSAGVVQMERDITPGFWAAGAIFIIVLLLIAFEKVHSTTAALIGLSSIFMITYVLGNIWEDFYIIDFERALTYINWEVIFLVMAMMIVIAVMERTGIFQWTAFQAYRISRGKTWLLALILMLVTAVGSALLDNFTTMLLMAPISLQIALALGINPLALIIPEVMASNVGGISTLIGTPTNILIGAYADIGFLDFLRNQTVGVVAALILMALYVLFHWRKEWSKHPGGISESLYERLERSAEIKDMRGLKISGIVFVLIVLGFVMGESFHVVPAVPALVGATLLLVWLKPDVHAMIQAVDWITLLFFMALFIIVGAVQEVGLIGYLAQYLADFIGDNLELGIFAMVFGVGTLSILVANIPLAASFLPIVEYLTGSIPGADSKVLYYALSMGAAMGGNGLLISAEANLVTAGITRQAGSPISFKEFMKAGIPVTYLTLLAGFVWLLIRF